jgi:succinyl-CoA synthetase beta subunit
VGLKYSQQCRSSDSRIKQKETQAMRIYEYEAKELFKEVGIAVPMSKLAQTPEHVREAAKKLNSPVILKRQTMLKARGKGG